MKAEEATDSFDEVYSAQVDQRGSFDLASKRMGRDRKFLRGQLDARGVRVPDVLHSLEVLDHPSPQDVFHTAFSRLDIDPAIYLEAAREPQQTAADHFFREMAPRLAALAAAGASPGGEWQSRSRKLEKLDKLRRQDRQLARERLNQLIAGMVERMEKKDERPRKALGELAMALGVLASLQRYAGRRGDALDLLQAARPLCLLARDPFVEGDWFVKSAILLVDLNRNTRAYQFVLEAIDLFFLAGAIAEQAQATVTSAYVLMHAEQHAESKKILEQVLPLLQDHQAHIRLIAHQTLAKNFRELGELDEACEQLSTAIGLAGDDTMARASCLWDRATLLGRLGDVSGAMASYHEALPLLAKLTGAAELAELAMEYAKLLFREGKWPELKALTIDLAGWIQELRGTSKLRAVIDEFARLVEFNRLSEEAFQKILKRLQAARAVSAPCTEVRSA
jgi:tetratricopeptide (TPR) repeat protein